MGLHRPSFASKQPGNQVSLKVAPIQDSIFSPSTNPQEGAVPVDLMHDQDNVATDVNNNSFEIGEVVAFRGTDGLHFNLLRVTHIVPLRNLRPRSRVRGVFMVKTVRDGDNTCYSVDPSWRNASMAYAYVLRDGNEIVVTLSLEEAVTVTETKFVRDVNRNVQRNSGFEDAIKRAMQSNESNEDKDEEGSTADTEEGEASESKEHEIFVYQDRRQRRGRGNRSET